MWFKNLRIFQFQTPISYNPEQLHTQLLQAAFKPCPKSHPYSYGWIQPLGDETKSLVFGQNGMLLIRLRVEEKVLPATVVRENVLAKIKEIESASGRRIYKDEKERIKDEVYQTLLLQAFTKSTYINGYLDTQKNWLLVDCANNKKLAQFISLLMKATNNVIFAPKHVAIPRLLTEWLTNQQHPAHFTIGSACLLKNPEESGSIVRIKNEDLFSEKVQAFLQDNSIVTQITLEWRENIRFTLKEDFTISSVRFMDAVKDLARDGLSETVEERFASDFMMMTQTVQQLLQDVQMHFFMPEEAEVEVLEEALV